MQHSEQPRKLEAPGTTIAERLAYWRALHWDEFLTLMASADGEAAPAARLQAPLVSAQLHVPRG